MSARRELQILELYSGIGGMHHAAKQSGIPCRVVWSLDINTSANTVYRHNFPNCKQQSRNIESLTPKEICKLAPDVIMMSPPCQPFTRVGLKKDVKDNRCSSFLHLVNIWSELTTIRYVLMENVAGFESSQMRDFFLQCLKENGFFFREFLISPDVIGIPNSRTRYYLLARKFADFSFPYTGNVSFTLPMETGSPERKTLDCFLEQLTTEQLHTYTVPDKVLQKYGKILDIRQKLDTLSCCFTKAYSHYAEGTGSVLQDDPTASLDQAFEEFSRTNDPASLQKLRLRYFTPTEIARLMGFHDEFSFPESVSDKTKYRLLGNSLNVRVVSELFKLLIDDTDNVETCPQ